MFLIENVFIIKNLHSVVDSAKKCGILLLAEHDKECQKERMIKMIFKNFEFQNLMNKVIMGEDFAVDIVKTADGFTLYADLAGFEKQNISLEFIEESLKISASKNEEEKNLTYVLRERGNNNVERIFSFGRNIDKDNIKAKMENGVLIVSLINKKDYKQNIIIE